MFFIFEPPYSMFELTAQTIGIIFLFSFFFGSIFGFVFFEVVEFAFSPIKKVKAKVTAASIQNASVPIFLNSFDISGTLRSPYATQYVEASYNHVEAAGKDEYGNINFEGDVSDTLYAKAESGEVTILYKRGYLSGRAKAVGIE